MPVALSLDSFQWNIGQVVGPVLGGAVLRGAGTTVFFGLPAAVIVPLVGFLLFWRGRDDLRLSTPGASAAESLMGAISSGWRYFSNTPGLRAIAARTALYVTPATALGAYSRSSQLTTCTPRPSATGSSWHSVGWVPCFASLVSLAFRDTST